MSERKTLKEHGIEILDHGLETGLIAVIHGAREGRVIALRCDMDALPIQEETGLAYASQNPGVMHACGHDFHTAIMLGAALLLKEREKELAGTIKGRSLRSFVLPIIPRRCDHLRVTLTGKGEMKLYSIPRILEVGSDA